MRHSFVILSAALVVLVLPLAVSAADSDLTLGIKRSFHSELLGEDRELWIHLPDAYHHSPESSFPLLVVLDARGSFKTTAAIVHSLSRGRALPPMIVVGIKNTDRWRDLTPDADISIPGSGGGGRFLEALESEILPWIDSNYRSSGFRVFSGHSLGGLMALAALDSKPDLFDAYIALSPSLEWSDGSMVARFRDNLGKTSGLDKLLYLALADEALERAYFDELVGLLGAARPQRLVWKSEIFDAEDDHMSIRVTGGLAGIRWVFRDWRLTSRQIHSMSEAQIDRHFAAASTRYKEPRSLDMMAMTEAAYWGLYRPETVDRAIDVFRQAVERWPDRPYPYACLGEGLERTGKLEEALAQMERALEMAKADEQADLPYFQGMVDRVRRALAQQRAEVGGAY